MPISLVVTFTGPDRPGLVQELTTIVAEHDGSWTDSRMASLAERFAGIAHITVPDARAGALSQALRDGATALGLRTIIDQGDPPLTGEYITLALDLTGHDQEGILRDVATVLAQFNVNIEEAGTEVESAPMSGELLFHSMMALSAPIDLDQGALEEALEAVSSDLQVDIQIMREEG